MKNKKITSLLVAGALTVGIVGGTLAWLTASDTATNYLSTAMGEVQVQVYEKFDVIKALDLEPGAEVEKNVQIRNAATKVDQFIRVAITENEYNYLKPELVNVVGLNDIKIQKDGDKITGVVEKDGKDAEGKWLKDGDFYYYLGKVATEGFTNPIMTKVTFDSNTNNADGMNKYKNIVIDAKSVQASNDAYKSVFEGISDTTKDALSFYQGQPAKTANLVEGSTNHGTHQ